MTFDAILGGATIISIIALIGIGLGLLMEGSADRAKKIAGWGGLFIGLSWTWPLLPLYGLGMAYMWVIRPRMQDRLPRAMRKQVRRAEQEAERDLLIAEANRRADAAVAASAQELRDKGLL